MLFVKRRLLSRQFAPRNCRLSTSIISVDDKLRANISDFFGNKSLKRDDVGGFLDSNIHSMGASHLVHFLYCSARAKLSLTDRDVEKIVSQWSSDPTPLDIQMIGSAFYGLRGLDATKEVMLLLKYLTRHVDSCNDTFEFSTIAQILCGLQRMPADIKQVHDILVSVINRLEHVAVSTVSPRFLGSALLGLKNMNNDHITVNRLLRSLASVIIRSQVILDAPSTRVSMYGIQNMSYETLELRELLAALASSVQRSTDRLSAVDVCVAIYGVRNLTSRSPEICRIISVLTSKLRDCSGEIDEQGLGMVMYSFTNKNAEKKEVRDLLKAVADHLRTYSSSIPVSDISIGIGLFRLQGMNSKYEEVRDFVGVMASRISTRESVLSIRNISNALYGLRHMDTSHAEVRQLVAALTSQLQRNRGSLVNPEEISLAMFGMNSLGSGSSEVRLLLRAVVDSMAKESSGELFTARQAAKCVNGFFSMSSEDIEVRELVAVLSKRLENIKGVMDIYDVSKCLNGLRGMSSQHREVLDLVKVLTAHFKNTFEQGKDEFGYKETLGRVTLKALGCLGNLDSSSPEVEVLVHTFISPLEQCKRVQSTYAVVRALWGLRNMSSDQYYVRGMMLCLRDKLHSSCYDLSEEDIRKCMVALRNKSSKHREVRELVEMLAVKIQEAEGVRLSSTYVSTAMSDLTEMKIEDLAVKKLLRALYVKTVLPSLKQGSSSAITTQNNRGK